MNREQFYAIMNGEGTLDYEVYLQTKALLSCQTDYAELCNKDELQFQLVHQVEELWMKLIAYTLLDIDEYLQQENTNRVLTLFRRIHAIQRLMIEQIALLETMALGLPAVASHAGGNPDVITSGETGLLVPPLDPLAWASALERVLGDREFAQRIARAGRDLVRREFTLERAAERTEAVYREAVERRRG